MRRTNIQHGEKRARPRSITLPAALAVMLFAIAVAGVWKLVMP